VLRDTYHVKEIVTALCSRQDDLCPGVHRDTTHADRPDDSAERAARVINDGSNQNSYTQ
jgi:hypothetical protein